MAHRTILTNRQRAALFDLPTDEAAHLQFYVLGEHDLSLIGRRRRPWNRLGFALQLCGFRYPGRLIQPGAAVPGTMLAFIGAQLGFTAEELAGYGTRRETRYEHSAALRVAWPGVITEATLAPANEADLAVAPQLLAGWALGDEGYRSPSLRAELALGGLDLVAP